MSKLTTHVLDTSRGRPAGGVGVEVSKLIAGGEWSALGKRSTDGDGRARDLIADDALVAGVYRLRFETGPYFKDEESFYPFVDVVFEVRNPGEHHHVPLLISPFGYSTYRGS